MKWATPLAFTFLIPVILIFVWSYLRKEKRRATFQFSSGKLFQGVAPSFRARLSFLPNLIKFIALVLAIIALARPQMSDTKINKNVEGIDIMLTLDISDSMLIEDMEPENRLGAAKMVIRNFVKARANDRIGIVVFAGESYTRCPLTLDQGVLLSSVDELTTDNMKPGTAIGVALANAVARLKDSTAKSRVIILLTDGESNSGTIDPSTALDIAKGYGIKVYTIGAGVDGQAQLPIYTVDAFGRKVKRYQPIHSTVNDELLQRIADETGAKYYRAGDTDTLKKVFSNIDTLEKIKIQVNEYVKYTELFTKWLYWAFVLYLLQFFLTRTLFRRVP
ncbi:MAG: VWA domain-containing protein [Oligoflexia bacterium]|nr:VWA domain-containing protein [Oligoflexia bacterium]